MKEPNLQGQGFLVELEYQGSIRAIHFDNTGLLSGETPSIEAILDPGSKEKFRLFTRTLDRLHSVLDWEINLQTPQGVLPFLFSALQQPGKIFLVASTNPADTSRLLDRVMEIHKSAESQEMFFPQTPFEEPGDSSLYDQMSQLNNELLNAQRELARKNARLERLNEEKNQMIGMVAHDLRNPIGAILNLTESIQESLDHLSMPFETKMLLLIQDTGEFMLQVLNRWLDLQNIEQGSVQLHMQVVCLNHFLEQQVEIYQFIASKKNIRILATIPHEELFAQMDEHGMAQVLGNLLSNAIKFSQLGGEITVLLEKQGKEGKITVRDKGTGMDQKTLSQLRMGTRQRVSGTYGTAGEPSVGLGLIITRQMLELHHSLLDIQSQRGFGTTVSFRLPLEETNPE